MLRPDKGTSVTPQVTSKIKELGHAGDKHNTGFACVGASEFCYLDVGANPICYHAWSNPL